MTEKQSQMAPSKAPDFLIHALYATGRNGEMGMADGSLPWRTKENRIRPDLPQNIKQQCEEDMALFKNLTTGNIILMGYNTYKTFLAPLSARMNVVIDRNAKESESDISEEKTEWIFFSSLETALKKCHERFPDKQIYIIGGAKLLKEAYSKKLITGNTYHTVIDWDFPEATVFYK
ncbi:MAG: dihydrofolate reductase [Treponema sp.]|nr:dihydrofolate reductase [Treponema sp.]